MTKRELSNHLGAFVKEHGIEESTKVLSRMLLGLAHTVNAEEMEFNDEGVGTVLVTPFL